MNTSPPVATLPLFSPAVVGDPAVATEPAAAALLPILAAAGVIVSTDGEKIRYAAPPGALTEGLRDLIRRNKPALIRALVAAGATAEPPEKPHTEIPILPLFGGSGVEEPPAVATEPPSWGARAAAEVGAHRSASERETPSWGTRAAAEALADPVVSWAVGELGARVADAWYDPAALPPDLAAEETALRAEIFELEERIEKGRALLATETDPGRRARYLARIEELTAQVYAAYDALAALPIDWARPGGEL